MTQNADSVSAAGLRARWLVAADGLHSPVRRGWASNCRTGAPGRYGLRRHYRVKPWTDFVEVHWSSAGEAYVTPVADDLVGVAVLSTARQSFDEHLAGFPDSSSRLARSDRERGTRRGTAAAAGAPPDRGAGAAGRRRRGLRRRAHR